MGPVDLAAWQVKADGHQIFALVVRQEISRTAQHVSLAIPSRKMPPFSELDVVFADKIVGHSSGGDARPSRLGKLVRHGLLSINRTQ